MASLSTSARLGNTSTSALIRSASSLSNQINAYNDSLAAYQFELSPKTEQDLSTYQDYLTKRIGNLQSTGSITDAQKALTLTKTLTSAVRSNVSADIQRENIQIMSGNASLTDKYSTIVGQYQRAISIGDLSLAQQLESQAYSVSQSIQYQAQQAAQAADTLAKAANSSAISQQGNIVTALDDSLKQLNNDVKNLGVKDLDKVTAAWVNQNRGALQSMGVIIPQGAQPNYFNLVEGVQAAKYNALVLKAQAQSVSNPASAQNTLMDAALLKNGATKISTLGGSLTVQEIQQAAQDPAMFAYDNATGQFKRTAQVGYQFINGQVAPEYSGIINMNKQSSGGVNGSNVQTMFVLNPTQTATLTSLGLNFVQAGDKTANDGVNVQLTANSPQWLQKLLGQNGETKMFTDEKGNLQFEGPSASGQGMSYYTLLTVGGLHGIFEHTADGQIRLAGGNYGFDAGAAQLLINHGMQQQHQIQLQVQAEQAAQAARLALARPAALPTIAPPPAVAPRPSATAPLQRTISTQSIQPTYNPQQAYSGSTNYLQPAGQITSNVQGIPLSQPHLNGIRL